MNKLKPIRINHPNRFATWLFVLLILSFVSTAAMSNQTIESLNASNHFSSLKVGDDVKVTDVMRLTIGGEFPFCQALLAEINRSKYPSLATGELLLSGDSEIRSLNWQQADVDASRRVLYKLFLHDLVRSRSDLRRAAKDHAKAISAKVNAAIANPDSIVQIAYIDLNQDGNLDRLYRYSDKVDSQPLHQLAIFSTGRYWRLIAELNNLEHTADADFTLHPPATYYDVLYFQNTPYIIHSMFGSVQAFSFVYLNEYRALKKGTLICSAESATRSFQ